MQSLHRLNQSTAALETHEDLFIARYGHLLAWALHLTGRDRAEAEDLLHDAYIQFTLSRPDLDTIHNLDGYLFGLLRVLWLSRRRRASRMRIEQLSAVEYDSAEMGLWLSDPRELNRVRDELRAICRYACGRKESSKAGSVLILRFFHGYYPAEIARLLQTTRKAVDSRLALARQEARVFLNAPERLSFLQSGHKSNNSAKAAGGQVKTTIQGAADTASTRIEDQLLRELRAEIFHSRRGNCVTRAELQRLYGEGESDAFTAEQLGHLASCPRCLDLANEILGLPLLTERHPNDTLGHDPGDSGGGPSGGAATNEVSPGPAAKFRTRDLERRSCQRARQVFEHRPQELHIAVNGLLAASQTVHTEWNEQTLELRPEQLAESPAFIEIFSELGVRLLLLYVDTTGPGPSVQEIAAEFSDNRSLTMTLQIQATSALLTVVYRAPLEPETAAASAPSWLRRFATWWQTGPLAILLRPAMTTALVAALILGAMLVYFRWPATPAVIAAEVLRKSIATEAQIAGEKGRIAHRRARIEMHNPATGELLAQYRLEQWQSADRGLSVRRVYDAQNRLLAGEWRHADGTDDLLLRKAQSSDRPGLAAPAQTIWRLALDPRQFSALVGTADISLKEDHNVYVLSHEWPPAGAAVSSGQLLKATIMLDRLTLRVVSQTMLLREPAGLREYHLTESVFEQLPASAAPAEIFQPDPELGAGDVRKSAPPTSLFPPGASDHASAQPAAVNLGAIEIEARYLLDQADANLGEQVSLVRTGTGLKVRALVETPQRKTELLSALSPLRAQPGVVLEVETYEEASRRQPTAAAAPSLITDAVLAQRPIPVAAELRRYFSAQAARRPFPFPPPGNWPDGWIEEQVTRFAGQMQEQAPRALRHAWALNALVMQLTPEEQTVLPLEAKEKWRKMVRAHALAIRRETENLRNALQPIFYSGASAPALPEVHDGAGMKSLAARLAALASEHDSVIGKAFSKSANESAGSALKSAHFRESLQTAEQLADAILNARELEPEQ